MSFVVVTASPAQAAGCVTKKEFRSVSKGMTKSRVHQVFGTKGKQSLYFDGYESREHRPCTSGYRMVMMSYDHGRVDSQNGPLVTAAPPATR